MLSYSDPFLLVRSAIWSHSADVALALDMGSCRAEPRHFPAWVWSDVARIWGIAKHVHVNITLLWSVVTIRWRKGILLRLRVESVRMQR